LPDGVWGAHRNFGPEVRGTLEITRAGQAWRARIAGHDQPIVVDGARLTFELAGARGGFVGRLGSDNLIHGHWLQPPTVNDGAKLASPVVLRPTTSGLWRGVVVPREDEFTLFLVVSRAADGTQRAFLRNPDRNIGLFWQIDRVAQTGDRVRLTGKFRGRGKEELFGEGIYHAEDHRLSIHFPLRGGTFDFTPVADDLTSDFYPRGAKPAPYRYVPPVAAGDGWKVATLAEVGMTGEPIEELVHVLEKPPSSLHDADIHGFLIARHGKLVAEEYFHGFHRERAHETRSAAKSVTATLVGAVIQSGTKLATSTRVYDLSYPHPPKDVEPRKRAMTVEHLLTMASGYDCDDWAGGRPGGEDTLMDEQPDKDYYRYTLQLPMELAPGKQAVYCSINANLLGAVVTASTQRPVFELFHELIAEPLQINRYYLYLQPTGEPYLGGGQKFLPRDFMKFGQLMLDGGVWNGKRVVSQDFATRASSPLVKLRDQPADTQYGYLWWTTDYKYAGRTVRAYFASGNGGQEVVVVPELDLVIATYGGSYNDKGGLVMVREYIPKYILAAVK